LDQQRLAYERNRDTAIDLIAKGMGLAVKEGEAKWSYDVQNGVFQRAKASRATPASPST